ncbi:hypothetical protein [Acinetobacter baumannii]|uniref:hypothetical protein n=1 Tax=Acinetobacter baumannii TaxID=470 RepID=UPI002B2387CD|nr:hypothetical protein [Acinetobacter baumannii]
MNAVVIAIAVMFLLSLARVSVVLTLVVSAIVGGLVAGLSLSQTVEAFNAGLGDGAEVALAYAVLGAFALALSKSTSEGELSPQLIRMLKQAGQAVPEIKPILEINPEHPLVKKLEGSEQFDDLANVIFDQAVIAEGGLPEDPAAYVKRINSLLLK